MARITGSRVTRSQSRQAEPELSKEVHVSGVSKHTELGRLPEVFTPAGFNRSRQVIPESPEDPEGHTNVSGTTLGPNEGELVDSQLGEKITSQLPFIQDQATLVMNILVPPGLNPDSIPAEASKLRDASQPNGRRLKRAIEGFNIEKNESPLAQHDKAYLDIPHLRRIIPPAQFQSSFVHLHMINCTALALDVFFPSGPNSKTQAIQDLDAYFPVCLMNNVAESSGYREIGATSSSQETIFSLALGIRTQFYIMELERRQQEHDFNPISVLRQVFCIDIIPNEDQAQEEPGSFRGFNLPGVFQDEDGHLPEDLAEHLQTAVSDRYNDILEEISEEDDFDVSGLKKSYKWRSFERDLARWIHVRSREIKEDIRFLSDKQEQMSPSGRRFTPAPIRTSTSRQVSALPPFQPVLAPQTIQASNPPETPIVSSVEQAPSPQREGSTNVAQAVDTSAEANTHQPEASPRNAASPSEATAPMSPFKPAQPATNDADRRKSKSNYRDASSFAKLKKRLENSRRQSLADPATNPPNDSVTTDYAYQGSSAGRTAGPRVSEPREIPASPEQRDVNFEDDLTYVNNDEDLPLGYGDDDEVIASTSPSASARINRVSHNANGLLGSPENLFPPRSNQGVAEAHRQTASPRRYFNEKQNDASKVSPIMDSQNFGRQRSVPANQVSNKRQRPVDNQNNDEDDEDDFEEDTRRPEKRQRLPPTAGEEPLPSRREPPANFASPSKTSRSRLDSALVARGSQSRLESEDLTDGETSTQRPPASQPSSQLARTNEPPSTAQSEHLAVIKARAVQKTRKTNNRWTDAEVERLLQLMEVHGTSYATILAEDTAWPASEGGPLLESRRQSDCKDKAVNVKKKILKEGKPVPKYLESITIRM